jgi:hypothetical protein
MTLESILTNFLESYMQGCFFCMPALVINVKDSEQLRVDVKPLVKRVYKDGTEHEYAPLLSVPCITPSTSNSALVLPVKHGDTVLLMFSQQNIEQFKAGTTTPHTPTSGRWLDINDAVAIVGLNPFNLSPNLKTRHVLPHNPEDAVLVHNLGTQKECEVRLGSDGSVSINKQRQHLIVSEAGIIATSGASSISITDGLINMTSPLVMVNGVNINTHLHSYTDDGVPSLTSPPVV